MEAKKTEQVEASSSPTTSVEDPESQLAIHVDRTVPPPSQDDIEDRTGEPGCNELCLRIVAFTTGLVTVPLSMVVVTAFYILPCVPPPWVDNDYFMAFSGGTLAGFVLVVIALIVLRGIQAFN